MKTNNFGAACLTIAAITVTAVFAKEELRKPGQDPGIVDKEKRKKHATT